MRRGLIAGLLAAASAGGMPADAAGVGATGAGDRSAELRALLVRQPRGPQDEAALVRAFAKLGPDVVSDLFDLQLGDGLDAFLAEGFDPSTWVVMPDALSGVALRALGELPDDAVIAHVEHRLAGTRDFDLELAALRTLGTCGSAKGIPLLLDVIEGLGTDLYFPAARATVDTALLAVVDGDPRSVEVLAKSWRELPDDTRELALRALIASGRPQAAEFLVSLIGRDPSMDLTILPGLAGSLQRAPWRLEPRHLEAFRGALRSTDPRVRVLALSAVGELDDEPAVDDVLRMLSDPDAGVRRTASAVLRAWSGNAPASTPEEWAEWRDREERWHVEELTKLLAEFAAETPPERIVEAVNALASHPVHRRDAVGALAALLPDLPPDFAEEACRLLVRLDGKSAVPEIVELLDSAPAGLQRHAWEALRQLTGASLGPDAKDWRAWLAR